MKRKSELKYLLVVLCIMSLGLFLVYLSRIDRDIAMILLTVDSIKDISGSFPSLFPDILYIPCYVGLFLLMHLYLRVKLPEADPFILPVVGVLSGVGLVMILRLSPDLAWSRNEAIQSILRHNPEASIKDNVLTLAQLGIKQFVSLVIGILAMIIAINVFNQRVFSWISSKKYFWVFLSAMLIIMTLLFGTEVNKRSLWLFGFQTVELVKLLVLFFISAYIYEKGKGIVIYQQAGYRAWLSYAGPFVAMWFFALIPLFVQRDLGPTFLIFIVFLLMFYFAGNRNIVTIAFIVLIGIIGYVSYKVGYPSVVHERFNAFFDPFGRSESMSRVLWSISSGGIFGSGIGYGQPYRIPVVQSDFNFAAIVEEMGFIGGISVVLCYVIFVHRCYRISQQTANIYKRSLVCGITVMIGLQAFTIICGNLGVIPMTGITLPFVSYGGSSMIINFLLIGIILATGFPLSVTTISSPAFTFNKYSLSDVFNLEIAAVFIN